jgi:hypothetical protein
MLQKSNWLKYWCKVAIIFLSFSIWSGICDNAPDTLFELKQLHTSEAGESENFDFEVKETGSYDFKILFMLGNEYNYLTCEDRNKLVGDANHYGIIIPISLRIIKDGKTYLDEKINTSGCEGKIDFQLEDIEDKSKKNIPALLRKIKTLELTPGHYYATITNLDNITEFKGITTVIWLTSNYPKI